MPMAQDFTYPSVSEVRYKDLRFLITDSPDDENIQSFTEVENHERKKSVFFYVQFFFSRACLKYGVTAVVRVSEKTYDTKPLEAAGIKVYVCLITLNYLHN